MPTLTLSAPQPDQPAGAGHSRMGALHSLLTGGDAPAQRQTPARAAPPRPARPRRPARALSLRLRLWSRRGGA